MPIYEYQCEACGYVMEVFSEIKERKPEVPCEKCGKNACRVYTIGGAFIKKVRVEDVWKAEGIEVGEGETIDRKQKNSERINKMREKDQEQKHKRKRK